MNNKRNRKFYILVAVVLIICAAIIFYVRFPLSNSNVAKNGDTVRFSFSGTADGQDVKTILDPQNSNKNWNQGSVTIGDYQEPQEIEQAVVDKKRGDDVNAKVTFPQDYLGTFYQFAGKTVDLKIHVEEVEVCNDGNGTCYPVTNKAQHEFEKAQKDLEKENKTANKELDAAKKLADEGKTEEANRKLAKATVAQENANAAYQKMKTNCDKIKNPEFKNPLETKLKEFETQNNDLSKKLNDVRGQINPAK